MKSNNCEQQPKFLLQLFMGESDLISQLKQTSLLHRVVSIVRLIIYKTSTRVMQECIVNIGKKSLNQFDTSGNLQDKTHKHVPYFSCSTIAKVVILVNMAYTIHYDNLAYLPEGVQWHTMVSLRNIRLKQPQQCVAKSMSSCQEITAQVLNIVKPYS